MQLSFLRQLSVSSSNCMLLLTEICIGLGLLCYLADKPLLSCRRLLTFKKQLVIVLQNSVLVLNGWVAMRVANLPWSVEGRAWVRGPSLRVWRGRAALKLWGRRWLGLSLLFSRRLPWVRLSECWAIGCNAMRGARLEAAGLAWAMRGRCIQISWRCAETRTYGAKGGGTAGIATPKRSLDF